MYGVHAPRDFKAWRRIQLCRKELLQIKLFQNELDITGFLLQLSIDILFQWYYGV